MLLVMSDAQIDGWVEPGFEGVRDAFVANFDRARRGGRGGLRVRRRASGGGPVGRRRRPPTRTTLGRGHGRARVLVHQGRDGGGREPRDRARPARSRCAGRLHLAGVRGGRQGGDHRSAGAEPPGRAAAGGGHVHARRGAVVGPGGRGPRRPGARSGRPGTQHGYHMRTYGWLVGELLRRASGRSPGRFVRDEVAEPLGLDIWIGLPEEVEPRVARVVPPQNSLRELLAPLGETLLLARVFGEPVRPVRLRRHVEHEGAARLRAAVLERHRRRPLVRPDVRLARRRRRRTAGACSDPRRSSAATVEQVRGHRCGARRRDGLRARVHARRQLRRGEPTDLLRPRRRRRVTRLRRPGDRAWRSAT